MVATALTYPAMNPATIPGSQLPTSCYRLHYLGHRSGHTRAWWEGKLTPAAAEPFMPAEGTEALENLAFDLAREASELSGQLHPIVRLSVAGLVRYACTAMKMIRAFIHPIRAPAVSARRTSHCRRGAGGKEPMPSRQRELGCSSSLVIE